MNQIQPLSLLLRRLWSHISNRRRIQFWILLFLMVTSSFVEILNIGAVIPFLGVLVEPEKIYNIKQLRPIIEFLDIKSPGELLLPVIIVFGALIVLTNMMRLVVIWGSTRLSSSVGADLSISVYRRTLYQPYLVHVSRSSSEVISVVLGKVNLAVLTITMMLNLIGAFIMLSAILITIIIIDPIVALIAFGGFGSIYFLIISLVRSKLSRSSENIAIESTNVLKTLQEGLGGIRDVLLDGSQEVYSSIFHKADIRARRAQGNIEIIGFCPRYGVETMALLLILGLAYFLASRPSGISSAIPLLGILALGAQRMLPVLQLAYGSWSGIRGNRASLQDTLDMLDQPLPAQIHFETAQPIVFNSEIKLEDIGFKYAKDSNLVLKNINLVIPKGARVGFIGRTGSGKSTLLDLIMGLLQPSEGTIEIDRVLLCPSNNRSWQSQIAHVPQMIYLSDSSIEQNIAFGVPEGEIDSVWVKDCAARAQIADIIEEWPLKYKTHVGERGIRLSGGQRQRIGLARALYKKANIIVLDEATSALDNETESAVIEAINNMDVSLTILMIAHRLTTLRGCSKIIQLENGHIVNQGTYDEIVTPLTK